MSNEKREAQHSRASREIGDTGKRHEHYSSGEHEEVRRLPIRFLPPDQTDWTIAFVDRSRLSDEAKRQTIAKLEAGEMTPQQANQMVSMCQ